MSSDKVPVLEGMHELKYILPFTVTEKYKSWAYFVSGAVVSNSRSFIIRYLGLLWVEDISVVLPWFFILQGQ